MCVVLGQDSRLRGLHSTHERSSTWVSEGSRNYLSVVWQVFFEFVERHPSLEDAQWKRDTRVHPLQEEIWYERGIHRTHAEARLVQAIFMRHSFLWQELLQASHAKTAHGDSHGRQSKAIRMSCMWHWICRARLPQAPYDPTRRHQKLRVHCLPSKILLQRSSKPPYEKPRGENIFLSLLLGNVCIKLNAKDPHEISQKWGKMRCCSLIEMYANFSFSFPWNSENMLAICAQKASSPKVNLSAINYHTVGWNTINVVRKLNTKTWYICFICIDICFILQLTATRSTLNATISTSISRHILDQKFINVLLTTVRKPSKSWENWKLIEMFTNALKS